jgi:hypothetical protein
VVCILGTAILIAARSPEPTSAATAAVTTPIGTEPAAKPLTPVVKTSVVSAKIAAKPQDAGANAAEPVTIEGCLVQDDQTFRLKNTAGEDAPKGRTWKSGFLHRGSKNLEVVDSRHRLNLSRHVGERVSVTGMLDEQEIQGTSLKRLAESCN